MVCDEKLDFATLEAMLASDDEDAATAPQVDVPPVDSFAKILSELEPALLADARASPLPDQDGETAVPPLRSKLGKPRKASTPRARRTPKPKAPTTTGCEVGLFLPLQGGHAQCDDVEGAARARHAAAAVRRRNQMGALSGEKEARGALDRARSAVDAAITMLHRQGWRRHHFATQLPQHARKRASLEAAQALVAANRRQKARAAPPLAGGADGPMVGAG